MPRSVMVWFRLLGRNGDCQARILAGLRAAGLQLVAAEEAGNKGPGVLCFEQIDGELFDALASVRGCPGSRVLALATSTAALGQRSWDVLQAGASEVAAWDEGLAAATVFAKLERWRAIAELSASLLSARGLVGRSEAWLRFVDRVIEAARFSSIPILLSGESGTGKEQIARLIHAVGAAHGAPTGLVTVDCSTIVSDLSGSEFFGHERGAFTGAHAGRDGAFASADGATLFLDEVGELPLVLQAQLLRVIQEKTYKRVGGNVWLKSDFRLVCATNRDLGQRVQQGAFRLDLYHRLAGWSLCTPSLNERREDILPLARHFLSASLPAPVPDLDPTVQTYLVQRSYPGNIRELRQLVQRVAHRHTGPGPISAGDVPEEERPAGGGLEGAWPDERLEQAIAVAIESGRSLKEIRSATTEAAIRRAMQSEDGNLQRAAKRLGVTDRALQMRRAAGALSD
jgi:transcriptional regulator with GAF, ATPase, and Fis domain